MNKSLVFLALMAFCETLSDAQSIPGTLLLTNYTVSPDEPVVGRVTVHNNENQTFSVEGPNATLFRMIGDEIHLSKKGRKYFRDSERCEVIISARNKGIPRGTFTIVKNDFHTNPVVAHRGCWKNTGFPQNSLAALEAAIALGVYGSEFDIHMTSDSVLVVNHDPDFNGMSIAQNPYEVLSNQPLANGEPLPTFEAFLKTGISQQSTRLIAELKPSPLGEAHSLKMAEKVIGTVRRMQAQAWMVYISFDYNILKKILSLDPYAKTQYLNGNVSHEQLRADGIDGADYHYSLYLKDEQWINKAHNLKLHVNAWTVNDPVLMEYFLTKRIDQITTDEPESLLDLFKTKDTTR
jgi:glycerophosphoryl diester phosphodiesterase